jgi:hypothetical protein
MTIDNSARTRTVTALIGVLVLANIMIWSQNSPTSFSTLKRYSSGTAFSSDGKIINHSDKLEINDEHFSFVVKYKWDDQNSVLHESGKISRGAMGIWDVTMEDSSYFGSPVLKELELDDDLLFGRRYMQSGKGMVRILPMYGELEGFCYYLIISKRVYCGSKR